jgi:hypothetical protein
MRLYGWCAFALAVFSGAPRTEATDRKIRRIQYADVPKTDTPKRSLILTELVASGKSKDQEGDFKGAMKELEKLEEACFKLGVELGIARADVSVTDIDDASRWACRAGVVARIDVAVSLSKYNLALVLSTSALYWADNWDAAHKGLCTNLRSMNCKFFSSQSCLVSLPWF